MDVGLDFKRSHLLNLVSILQIHLTVFDPARKFNQIPKTFANGSEWKQAASTTEVTVVPRGLTSPDSEFLKINKVCAFLLS